MSNRFLGLSAATALLAATPALANADVISYSTSSPVAITSFRINESLASIGNGDDGGSPQFITNGVTLTFVNRSNIPATSVIFRLGDGKYSQSIVDTGTFSPAAQITHTFLDRGDGSNAFTNATVSVAEVDFADGSAWHVDPHVAKATAVTMPTLDAKSAGHVDPAQNNTEHNTAEWRRMLFHNQGTSN